MKIVTTVVPLSLIQEANEVVYFMRGVSRNTYQVATVRDSAGNDYCLSSGQWTEAQIQGVQDPNIIAERVSYGNFPEDTDINFLTTAQANYVFVELGQTEDGEVVSHALDPGKITGIGADVEQAMMAFGLHKIPFED